mmetsp:Transcript_57858/g.179798  ORF Transcript_57858/g.179798 Transcript_57858/m.179798 type:complete len:319 (-) Transcript_57858:349-1305(-)
MFEEPGALHRAHAAELLPRVPVLRHAPDLHAVDPDSPVRHARGVLVLCGPTLPVAAGLPPHPPRAQHREPGPGGLGAPGAPHAEELGQGRLQLGEVRQVVDELLQRELHPVGQRRPLVVGARRWGGEVHARGCVRASVRARARASKGHRMRALVPHAPVRAHRGAPSLLARHLNGRRVGCGGGSLLLGAGKSKQARMHASKHARMHAPRRPPHFSPPRGEWRRRTATSYFPAAALTLGCGRVCSFSTGTSFTVVGRKQSPTCTQPSPWSWPRIWLPHWAMVLRSRSQRTFLKRYPTPLVDAWSLPLSTRKVSMPAKLS